MIEVIIKIMSCDDDDDDDANHTRSSNIFNHVQVNRRDSDNDLGLYWP